MTCFNDKVTIITGASEGIGRAIALMLARHQTKLVISARNKDRLDKLKKEIEKRGSQALVVAADLTEKNACENMIKTAINHFGSIDILINNAGRTMWTRFDEIKNLSMFEDIMNLNYLSAVYSTYFALPYLKKSKGTIVGISSVAGMTGVPYRTAYAASKHAMFGFFDSLRIELQDSGVNVIMIAPDFVVSQIHKRALDGNGNPLGQTPVQESKVMTADECAQKILKSIEKKNRLLITSLRGRLSRWIKLIAPSLMDIIAAKAIEKGK